ncbi:hypothetical protein HEP75_00608 [Xanthomonas sp. SI]|nr:hypothetical protein HEP75_00608 [Xanthomonas sp. SI]
MLAVAESLTGIGGGGMGMLDGVSECWWLSTTCVVNWDAWAAIGTVAAVWVALMASGAEWRRLRRERKERAMWLREELRQPVHRWHVAAAGALGLVKLGQDHNLQQLLTKENDLRYPLHVPEAVVTLRPSLHDMGGLGIKLARAVGLARRLQQCDILGVLRQQYNKDRDAASVRIEFREDLSSLVAILVVLDAALQLPESKSARRTHPRRRFLQFLR